MFRVGGFHSGVHAGAFGGSHGWGGFRPKRGGPLLSGTVHVRTSGIYSTRYGHANTAFRFGHTNTAAPNGFRRPLFGGFTDSRRFDRRGRGFGRRDFASYAFAPRGSYRRRWVVPGVIGAGGYGYGEYLSAGPSYSVAPGYGGYGYAEPPLAAIYSEAPLGPSPYPGYDGYPDGQDAGYAPSAGYEGGPQVIVVHAKGRARRSEGCSCGRGYAVTPVVYRFGVGSYY